MNFIKNSSRKISLQEPVCKRWGIGWAILSWNPLKKWNPLTWKRLWKPAFSAPFIEKQLSRVIRQDLLTTISQQEAFQKKSYWNFVHITEEEERNIHSCLLQPVTQVKREQRNKESTAEKERKAQNSELNKKSINFAGNRTKVTSN